MFWCRGCGSTRTTSPKGNGFTVRAATNYRLHTRLWRKEIFAERPDSNGNLPHGVLTNWTTFMIRSHSCAIADALFHLSTSFISSCENDAILYVDSRGLEPRSSDFQSDAYTISAKSPWCWVSWRNRTVSFAVTVRYANQLHQRHHVIFFIVSHTGLEPVFPPWKGGELTCYSSATFCVPRTRVELVRTFLSIRF